MTRGSTKDLTSTKAEAVLLTQPHKEEKTLRKLGQNTRSKDEESAAMFQKHRGKYINTLALF